MSTDANNDGIDPRESSSRRYYREQIRQRTQGQAPSDTPESRETLEKRAQLDAKQINTTGADLRRNLYIALRNSPISNSVKDQLADQLIGLAAGQMVLDANRTQLMVAEAVAVNGTNGGNGKGRS